MNAPALPIVVTLPEGCPPRLDKALAAATPEEAGLSRSRLQALIAEGAVSRAGTVVTDPKSKVRPGEEWEVRIAEPVPLDARPEDIPLAIIFEDADLIVIDKPPGMVVHPAPGAETGTLVNALLHHCGDELSGIGGTARPGIVHRIDKDTSGLLVIAKSDAAHRGLSRQFADHSVERRYMALVWGAPSTRDPRLLGLPGVSVPLPGQIRIATQIGRHPADRKKMAVLRTGGRHAVTHVTVSETFGPAGRPVCALTECRLETGRTHQIRVHMTYVGHPLVGDPVYGSARKVPKEALNPDAANALESCSGQALHARTLGFVHPVTEERMNFESPPSPGFNRLLSLLRGAGAGTQDRAS